jgi:hypothetical protein
MLMSAPAFLSGGWSDEIGRLPPLRGVVGGAHEGVDGVRSLRPRFAAPGLPTAAAAPPYRQRAPDTLPGGKRATIRRRGRGGTILWAVILTVGKAVFDRQVPSLDVSGLPRLATRVERGLFFWRDGAPPQLPDVDFLTTTRRRVDPV